MSRQGLGKDFATVTRNRTRGGINEQVNGFLGAVDGLPDVHKRLATVLMYNQDAMKVIDQQDGEKTLFYLDPPYVHSTRTARDAYRYEMQDEKHMGLLAKLRDLQGKFLLSGYHCEIYDDCASMNGWTCHEYETPNHSSSTSTKEIKTECLWSNF